MESRTIDVQSTDFPQFFVAMMSCVQVPFGHLFKIIFSFKILIEAGANINRQSTLGITPLIDAAAAMNMDMLEYLMETGAKLHLQERDGWTAADHLEHNIEKMDDSQFDHNIARAQLVLKKMRESLHKLNTTGHNVIMVKKKAVSTVFVTEDGTDDGMYLSSIPAAVMFV